MDKLLTPNETAKILNCKPSTIYAWAKAGTIPAFKLNGLIRFDSKEIEEWVRQNRIQTIDIEKQAQKIMKDIDIDNIVRNSIDTVKGSGYTFHHKGKPDQSARKGGSNESI